MRASRLTAAVAIGAMLAVGVGTTMEFANAQTAGGGGGGAGGAVDRDLPARPPLPAHLRRRPRPWLRVPTRCQQSATRHEFFQLVRRVRFVVLFLVFGEFGIFLQLLGYAVKKEER